MSKLRCEIEQVGKYAARPVIRAEPTRAAVTNSCAARVITARTAQPRFLEPAGEVEAFL